MNRFAIGHSVSQTKRKLEQIYATACEWLEIEPDDGFVQSVLDDRLKSSTDDVGTLLISRLLTQKLGMPSAALGLFGVGLLLAIKNANGEKQAELSGVPLTRDEATDVEGLAGRLLLPEIDPSDARRAADFIKFLLNSHGPKSFIEFGRALKLSSSVDEASRVATSVPIAILELAWQESVTAKTAVKGPGYLMIWTAKSVRPYVWLVSLFLAANAIQIAYAVMVPVWMKDLFDVFDNGIQETDWGPIETAFGFLVAGLLLTSAAGAILDYCVAALGPKALNGTRMRMFEKLEDLSARSLARHDNDEIISSFASDLMVVEKAVVWAVPGLLAKFLILVGSVVVAFSLDWRLASALLASMALSFLAPRLLSNWSVKLTYRRGMEDAKVVRVVKEMVNLERIIRMFGLQKIQMEQFSRQLNELYRISLRQYFSSGLISRATNFGVSASQLIVVGLGAYLAIEGEVTVGTIVAFITLLLSIGGTAGFISGQLPILIQAVGSLQRVNDFLAQPIETIEPDKAMPLDPPIKTVTLDHVSFSYKGDKADLDDVSLELTIPKHVAIVGPSGSGKSTFLYLIERQFDPTDGKVLMNGIDIRKVGSAQLQSMMSVVPQDSLLFQTSVRENIRMGKLDATDQEIETAAKEADVHDIIVSFPDGYDTDVGEGGKNLSGGQRQRVAIARALIRNPEILLLDEATSALDLTSAAAINETLERVTKNRTVFAITHRLDECKNMDLICVFDAGKLVETGTHEELLSHEGTYADLWSAHSASTESGNVPMDWIIGRLNRAPLFRDVPAEVLEHVYKAMQQETIQSGVVLQRQGDPSSRFAFILNGKVDRTLRMPDGTEKLLESLDNGESFGEFVLLDNEPYVTTITAKQTTTLLTIGKQELVRLLGRDPELLAHIETMLRQWLDDVREHITWRKLHT